MSVTLAPGTGARVTAVDTRPAVEEQVTALGAWFVKIEPDVRHAVIEAYHAKTVLALKRGQGAGFSGLVKTLFFRDNTRMLYGDAKSTISGLVGQFKDSYQLCTSINCLMRTQSLPTEELLQLAETIAGHSETNDDLQQSINGLLDSIHNLKQANNRLESSELIFQKARQEKDEAKDILSRRINDVFTFIESESPDGSDALIALANTLRKTINDTAQLHPPTGVEIMRRAPGMVEIDWKMPNQGERPQSYRVEVSPAGSGRWHLASVTMYTNAKLASLPQSQKLSFRVISVAPDSRSLPSEVVTSEL